MPRVGCGWQTRDDWARCYRMVVNGDQIVTYGDDRGWSGDSIDNDVWHRANALKAFMLANGGALADRILIAGAGMGFLIETLKLVGFTNVFGLDSSPWCQSKKATVNNGVILINADFTGSANSLRNAFNAATGGRDFRWIVTDAMLESYNDNDISIMLAQGPALLTNGVPVNHIIHIVFIPPFDEPGLFNEKTMAQWKAMAPNNTWMNAEGYKVE